MIEISGTTVIDRVPKGGDSIDLMLSILRAREAADSCYTLAIQAERGEHPFLATFWNEIAELHAEVLERTATAVERLREESEARASEDGESGAGERPTGHQRPDDDPKRSV
jgi:hypothetical protein